MADKNNNQNLVEEDKPIDPAEGPPPNPPKQSHEQKKVRVSKAEGQLDDDQDLGQVALKPTNSSVLVRREVQTSTQLPEITIKSNKSAIIPRNGNTKNKEKVTYKKPYSEPRSERDPEDNFSEDNISQTRSEMRHKNLLVSLGLGALLGLGAFYLSGKDKKIAGVAGAASFLGMFYMLQK